MPDHETTRRMLAAAGRDVQALGNMLSSAHFPDEIFGLIAQQAVEKSLKAWLAYRDQEVSRTHNLRLLLVLLLQAGEAVSREWDFINLTAFAVQFRYEACEPAATSLNRPATLAQITELVNRVADIASIPQDSA